MVRRFHIREKKVKENSKSYTINKLFNKGRFYIPKSQVIRLNHYTKTGPGNSKVKENWVTITVTDWAWNKVNIPLHISGMQEVGEVFVEGETHQGINWDYVISKRRDSKRCFYCMRLFDDLILKTRDHVIPKAILKAFGISSLPNNTVPCCEDCNGDKANLHPTVYKKYIMMKLHETGEQYYRIVLDTLTRLIAKQ